jgi:hypothetical protein
VEAALDAIGGLPEVIARPQPVRVISDRDL